MSSARWKRQWKENDDNMEAQVKAINDLATRGQIDVEKEIEMKKTALKNHNRAKDANDALDSPMWGALPGPRLSSNLPKGVALTPKGDIGKHRGQEAKVAGGFKGAKIKQASKELNKGR